MHQGGLRVVLPPTCLRHLLGEASITATSLDWLVVVLDDLSREGGDAMVRYFNLR